MSLSRTLAVIHAIALVVAVWGAISLVSPATAQADNCQPEELVLRAATGNQTAESPIYSDANDPRCIALAELGCPNLQDPAGCINGIAATAIAIPLGCQSPTNPVGLCDPAVIAAKLGCSDTSNPDACVRGVVTTYASKFLNCPSPTNPTGFCRPGS